MFVLLPPVLAALALQFLAHPTLTSSSILPRAQYCSNAPNVVAGSTFTHRLLLPRGNPIRQYWCAPNSRTYIVFSRVVPVGGSVIFRLLVNFNAHLDRVLPGRENRLLPGGGFSWGEDQLYSVQISNANNHQCTFGVMRSAVAALTDFMTTENTYGTMSFEIWDGENEVGLGVVG